MQYPNLKTAREIALDTETRDPELLVNGPGGFRGCGNIIGVSLAVDGWSEYYPLFHAGGDNVPEPENCVRWLKDTLETDTPKIGANILYDLEWLFTLGIHCRGPKYDVQTAEALLDETMPHYSLEEISQKRLGYGKMEDGLTRAAADYLGIPYNHLDEDKNKDAMAEIKGSMWKLPGSMVSEYARIDAENTLLIWQKQKPELLEQDLFSPLMETEAGIVDVLFSMRKRGVSVDLGLAGQLYEEMSAELTDVKGHIAQTVGFIPNIWAADDIKKACTLLGIEVPVTDKGNTSIQKSWLESRPEKFFSLLLQARSLDRMGGVFIKLKIIDLEHNGVIRPQFWAVKTDTQGVKHGTSSGRFACSNPNIQQVPARGPLAQKIRSIFKPNKGERWLVSDWSQQEPRLTVHFASQVGSPGAEQTAQAYRDNPRTDFHQYVADLAEIDRKQAKIVFLGLTYGMGKKKLAKSLGLSYDEANKLSSKIFEKFPYIPDLVERTKKVAMGRGYIKTLLGRRMRFDLYGPSRWSPGILPLGREEAIKEFGPHVQRYFIHKSLNRLIQGSAADMVKMAMVKVFRAGYTPLLTLHDELDFSVSSDAQIKEISEIMCDFDLSVPMTVDLEVGPSWGEVKEI